MPDNNIQKNQSAKKAHEKLLNLLEKMRNYEQSALLVFSEIMHKKLYEKLGYSSMHNYATEALKIPRSTAFHYINLSKKLETLPETRKAVASGELGWTKAKEVAKVATPKSEARWVAEAKKSSRRDSGPSTQIVIRHCPECGKAETGAGEVDQCDLEKAYCDAQVLENGRNKSTIKPSTRREVLSRDNHTCQGQGCSSKRYLEVHHKVPRAMGGNNNAENLVTLCSACHRLVHNRRTYAGDSPEFTTF